MIIIIIRVNTWNTLMSLQKKEGNIHSRIKIVNAVIGRDVRDIKISETAKHPMNTLRTDRDTC